MHNGAGTCLHKLVELMLLEPLFDAHACRIKMVFQFLNTRSWEIIQSS
jgi:hypothetical protein